MEELSISSGLRMFRDLSAAWWARRPRKACSSRHLTSRCPPLKYLGLSRRTASSHSTARDVARMMFDHGIGVRSKRAYEVKVVDDSYFEEEA